MMSTEDKLITSLQLPAENACYSGTVPTPAPAKHTKSATVSKLLRRAKGATLVELQEATAWQAHSVRAFLSSLRKKGSSVTKEQRKSGETAYRLIGKSAADQTANA